MYRYNPVRIIVSPAVPVVLAVFICLSSSAILSAIILAALCHELGHYMTVRLLGGWVDSVTFSALGAEMQIADERRLSYGREILATAAGPMVNLLLSVLMATAGRYAAIFYLFAGVQLVLGIFNLLPITPLDGGSILWLFVAWISDPYTADRVAANVGLAVATALLAMAAMAGREIGGNGFVFFMAVWLLLVSLRQKLRLI